MYMLQRTKAMNDSRNIIVGATAEKRRSAVPVIAMKLISCIVNRIFVFMVFIILIYLFFFV